jgi:hypothetical protein
MKRISVLLTLVLVAVVSQAAGQTSLNAKTARVKSLAATAPTPRCTLRSVRGDYAITFNGTVISPAVGVVATLGVISLDGSGGFVIRDTASFAGAIIDRVGAGTINLNANCTGDATVTYTVGQPGRTATFNFVVVDGGREIHLISTTAGSVVTGLAKALDPGSSQ